MNIFKIAILLYALTCSSFALAQNVKNYNCEWKAMRSTKNPNFTPYGGLKGPGKVSVSEDLVSYGSAKFQRAHGIPPQKRPNGTVLIIYSNGEDMISIAYTPDTKVQISLMQISTEINLVGDCLP